MQGAPGGTLVVIDALNYLFRAYHALPSLTTKAGLPTGAAYGFAQMLLRVDREHRPSHLCVVFDAPGRTFRDDLYAGYKGERPATPEDLLPQIDLARELAEAWGSVVFAVPGVEADDVIATLARLATADGLSVIIGSSDKDLMQLCSDQVHLLDAVKNRLLGPAEVKERWGVGPGQLGDLLALTGDTIDCIPGIPGVGPKTAAELLATYGSLDAIVANARNIKGKRSQAIAEGQAALALARQLVALRADVPLPVPIADLRRQPPPVDRLRELLLRLEFGRLLDQLERRASDGAAAASVAPAAPVSASDSASTPRTPGPPAILVTEGDGLRAMVDAIRTARSCALAFMLDAASPVSGHYLALAVALPSGPPFFVPVRQHVLGAAAALGEDELCAGLRDVLADATIAKHLHDAKHLEVGLRVRGLRLAGVASDTMLAGYVLESGAGAYDLPALARAESLPAVDPRASWRPSRVADAPDLVALERQLTAEAAAILALSERQAPRLAAAGQERLYREVELALMPVLAHMECTGIRLDSDHLRRLGNEVAGAAGALEREIHGLAGAEFNIGSPKQLAEILFGKLALPVLKKTKTGPSTDAEVLEELAALHPLPAKIIEYRTLAKLKGTYIDALPALVNARTGRLHTTFHQAVAATGRLSSSDPNLQNIPIRSEIGRKIRDAFVADEGFVLLSADYSQIELRVLAHFSGDPAFVDAFANGADIHRRTAAEVFGVAEAEVTAEQRRIAKAINFGLAFGQTDFGLAQVLRIPRHDARRYIETYFARYARVHAYMQESIAEARRTRSVSTLLGRARALPEIAAKQPQARNYAERIARNTPIQGSAADILKLAMLRVYRGLERFPSVRLLLTVHDELVLEVPEASIETFRPWLKHEMESAFELRVPLLVEVHAGRSWGEAHA